MACKSDCTDQPGDLEKSNDALDHQLKFRLSGLWERAHPEKVFKVAPRGLSWGGLDLGTALLSRASGTAFCLPQPLLKHQVFPSSPTAAVPTQVGSHTHCLHVLSDKEADVKTQAGLPCWDGIINYPESKQFETPACGRETPYCG